MTAKIIEEHGYFWWSDEPVPEQNFAPDSAVGGTLRVENDGRIDLELDGILPNKHGPLAVLADDGVPLPSEKRIYGILKTSDKFVVLSELRRNGGHFKSGGISYEKYFALHALVGGGSLQKGNGPARFHALRIELKGFEDWLMLRAIETKRTRSSVTARYRAPKDIAYAIEDGKLSIQYDISVPSPGKSRSERVQLTESASIHYVPRKSTSLEAMKTQYGLLMDLFVLLSGSDYCLDWPVLTYGKEKNSCQFFFMRHTSTSEPPKLHECWTTFPRLRDHFGEIFSAWRRQRERFGPGIYLYLGTRRGARLYEEHRFVNLIWGLESLHRRKTPRSEVPSRLKQKIERILGQIEKNKDREWLERQLQHADEPALEQRLFETLKVVPLGIDEKALRKFCVECATKRNDISHFGGQRHDEDYHEFVIDINKRSTALSYLYHVLLLQDIGVDREILSWFVYRGYQSFVIKVAFVVVGLLPKSVLKFPQSAADNKSSQKKENGAP